IGQRVTRPTTTPTATASASRSTRFSKRAWRSSDAPRRGGRSSGTTGRMATTNVTAPTAHRAPSTAATRAILASPRVGRLPARAQRRLPPRRPGAGRRLVRREVGRAAAGDAPGGGLPAGRRAPRRGLVPAAVLARGRDGVGGRAARVATRLSQGRALVGVRAG